MKKSILEHSAYSYFEEIISFIHPSNTLPDEIREALIEKMIERFDPFAHIMSTEEAADKWNISQERLRVLCKSQTIRNKKMGGTLIIDRNQTYERERAVKKIKSRSDNHV